MSAFALTVTFVFSLVGLGYFSGLSGLLKAEVGAALTDFVMVIALPILLFRMMVTAEFGSVAPWSLWLTYFTAIAASWVVGQFVTASVFGRDRRASIIGGLASSFSNLVLLGLPFCLSLFGQAGASILLLVIAVHLPVMMAVSVILFALVGRDAKGRIEPGREIRGFLVALATNHLVVGILLGLGWRITGLALPQLAWRIIETFADIAGPLALFAMGLGLRRFGISGNLGPALVLSALKLGFMPLVALGMALLLDLPPLTAKIAVLGASMPTGVNPFLFAMRFGTGQALSSNTLSIATLAAVFTTFGWLAVVQALFG